MNIKYLDVVDKELNGDIINKGNDYSINDCILVRTTDVFPFDKIIQTPINGNAYGFGKSSYIGEIIAEKIRKLYPKHGYDNEEAEKYSKELEEYEVCFETCRRTIHFALNGLVGSTAYGNFDNKPFVILEPLKYHLDETICSLRVEDTYFKDDMRLSDESIILISEETFNKIKDNIEYLEQLNNFNVYVYKGNQQVAIAQILSELGYDAFLISSNGYVNGLSEGPANNMWEFVNDFAKNNNISLDRHFYSQINMEDTIIREEKGLGIDKAHLLYLLDNSNISIELSNQIRSYLQENINKLYFEPLLEQLVNEIGLENIKRLTKDFNNNYINQLKNNTLLTKKN